MAYHNPKAEFQQDKERRERFASLVADPAFKSAVTYALAEFAASGASQEQLAGANRFVSLFANLSEPDEPATFIPAKQLQTY